MKIRNQKGFTLIELLIVVAIIGIIAAIAVPGLLRARMSGNEASAIGSMRAINTAQQNYSQMCNGYAPVLTELAPPPLGAGAFLSPDLSAATPATKSGYTITLTGAAALPAPLPAGCTGTGATYYASAVALSTSTGSRAFATGESGTIFYTSTPLTAPTAAVVTAGTGTPIQ
jgi:type IV pilus assembly protein PilA